MRGVRFLGARWTVLLAGLAVLGGTGGMQPAGAPSPPSAGLPDRPGEALRQAVEAIEAGKSDLALQLVTAIAQAYPLVADYADLLHMRLLVEGGHLDDAIALVARDAHPGSPTRVELLELLGRAHAEQGDEAEARSAWERASRATGARDRLASLGLRIADSFARSGKLDLAARSYRRLWVRYPDLAEGDAAGRALDEIEPELKTTYRDATHTLERGENLYQSKRNEKALAAFDRAIALGLPRAVRIRADAGRADTLFRLRRYPEAALAYEKLPRSEETRIQEARCYARAGDVERGAHALEALGNRSRTGQGTRALLLAALLWDGEDDWEHAKPLYERVIARAPGTSAAGESRWRLGWEAYTDGRLAEARAQFEKLAATESDPLTALRPRYWALRARERAGDPDVGAGYAALAAEFPLTYYGWRAAQRVPPGDPAPPRAPQPIAQGTRALSEQDLARVRILIEAGLLDAVDDELAGLQARARGLDDRLALAQLHAELGEFDRAQRLIVHGYGEGLSRGPVPEQIELWWHAWPAPFEEEVREAKADGVRLDSALLYSIMREESGYRPDVISVSGARGLLQLMPATAERVAREIHLPEFSVDDLFVPSVNIRLGAAYLESLLREFDGRRSAAVGSYNAGPQVVTRWLAKSGGEDDEFVEEIPYNQTRAYVKRVMRSFHAYRVLY